MRSCESYPQWTLITKIVSRMTKGAPKHHATSSVWGHALQLAAGDHRRLEVLADGTVVRHNRQAQKHQAVLRDSPRLPVSRTIRKLSARANTTSRSQEVTVGSHPWQAMISARTMSTIGYVA